MSRSLVLLALVACGSCAIVTRRNQENLEAINAQQSSVKDEETLTNLEKQAEALLAIEKEQNKNAFYHFESAIKDNISDLTQSRTETREGAKVTGSYSYSDGYHKRTVSYIADENGFRVVGEEVEPLEGGPVINDEGTASVKAIAHGNSLKYTIKSIPVEGKEGEDAKVKIYETKDE